MPTTMNRREAVALAFCVAFVATVLEREVLNSYWQIEQRFAFRFDIRLEIVRDVGLLIFGLLLVATNPRRSGISLGSREHRRKALLVSAAVVGLVLVYRLFFDGAAAFSDWNSAWSVWVISPVAQELVFSGFILGLLNDAFPKWWHRSVPLTTGVVIAAALFGMWHFIPDFFWDGSDTGWVLFRVAYTAGGWIPYCMTRLWTGSIIYAVVTHMLVNFIVLGF